MSLSESHVICCNSDGEVFCWGQNVFGNFGGILGPISSSSSLFVSVQTKNSNSNIYMVIWSVSCIEQRNIHCFFIVLFMWWIKKFIYIVIFLFYSNFLFHSFIHLSFFIVPNFQFPWSLFSFSSQKRNQKKLKDSEERRETWRQSSPSRRDCITAYLWVKMLACIIAGL